MSKHTNNPLGLKTDLLGRLQIGEVLRLANFSKATLYRMIKKGQFPQPLPGWRSGQKRLWAYDVVYHWACSQPGSKLFKTSDRQTN